MADHKKLSFSTPPILNIFFAENSGIGPWTSRSIFNWNEKYSWTKMNLKWISILLFYAARIQACYLIVRAANSKLLGTKILELPKLFRVQTWKYLKNFSEVRTYLNSKFEFQVFLSLLEKTLTHFLLLFDIIKRNMLSASKCLSMCS